MVGTDQIREHMDIVGSDGGHVGKVDSIEGQRIKLTRGDSPDNEHHYLHMDMVDRVEDGRVRLTRTSRQARDEWGVKSVGSNHDGPDGQQHGSPEGR